MFTGWIYDHLNSRGAIAKVGHPAMLKAIGAGKKKNDHIDARKISKRAGASNSSKVRGVFVMDSP
jgi:hypothetical protein